MNSKKLLYVTCFILLVLGIAGTVWAQGAAYNRPNPSMDYTPQELGFYDTMYYELTEHNCRECHGNITADRHHGVPQVVIYHVCNTCHLLCNIGEPDCENGITIHRNCITSGCHSPRDVQFGNQAWHHNTDLTDPENCTACHNPNLIEKISPFRSFAEYPPSVIAATPFSCENCHWAQEPATVTGDANAPGHPSTYAHYDELGNYIGFHEYGKPIFNNIDTHHFDFVGEVASECYKCHSQDPGNPSWDPYNPELIRYCEICHSVRSLHLIQTHVALEGTDGWLPVGFHANPGSPPVRGGGPGPNPTTYAKWGSIDYTPQVNPGYTADRQCWGCHGSSLPMWLDIWGVYPAIDTIGGISPTAGSCGVIGQLRGDFFGVEQFEGSEVQMKLKADPLAPWITVPIHSWTDNLIEFQIPCWTLAPGNYLVRVHTEAGYYNYGNSNRVVFTVKDGNTPPYINNLKPKQIVDPDAAPYPLLKIFGGNFGLTQEAGDSVRIGKKLDALRPALGLGKEQIKVVLWSDTLIKVRADQIPNIWRGKTRYVWIEKGGMKSNIKPLAILSPLP